MPSSDDPPVADSDESIRPSGGEPRGDSQPPLDPNAPPSDSSTWFDTTANGGIDLTGPSIDHDGLTVDSPASRQGGSSLVSTTPFRPSRRPPMALLRVWDDGQRDAETVRVRQTPFVIGRQDGDLVIGHERQMSRRHARIDRVQEGEAWRWYLGDLRSTNGTFVQVPQTRLEDGVEVLLGGELVRFLESPTGGSPTLVKVAPADEDERVQLTEETHLIGSDAAACLPFLHGSRFLDPHHFRVERSGRDWRLMDLGSTNQLWVAITKRHELIDGAKFQIGEQRFSFRLP